MLGLLGKIHLPVIQPHLNEIPLWHNSIPFELIDQLIETGKVDHYLLCSFVALRGSKLFS